MYLRYFTLILALLSAAPSSAVRGEVTEEAVDQTIERMKKYLYSQQDFHTGNWEFRSGSGGVQRDIVQAGGETSLVTLAMLASGETMQRPQLSRALQYLRSIQLQGTYAVAMRAHVWARLPQEFMPMLEIDASWLVNATNNHKMGLFDYRQSNTSSFIDNSVAQYGILGLWEASKRGLKIPRTYWERWAEYFIQSQLEDGSWIYGDEVGGIGSGNIFDAQGIGAMTTAGLTTLLVAQQELFYDRKMPEPRISAAINKAIAWLDSNFDLHSGQSGYNHYYLYGIEQVALASGVRYLNGLDWYSAGANQILQDSKLMEATERDFIKTAFAMMFLARGRYPVWVTKLKLSDHAWNNRPNDIYFLSQFLSDQREGEVNWQVVDLDHFRPDETPTTPIVYLASNEAIELTDKQRDALKRYLDWGGLLVTSSDNNSAEFTESIRSLAHEMYPQYKIRPLEKDHSLFFAWHQLSKNDRTPIYGLSNGARELIMIADFDLGYALQTERGRQDSAARRLATNLFAYATDKGVLRNRLAEQFEHRIDRNQTGSMTIGRPRYNGNWLPEPAAWEIQSNYIFNRTGLDVTPTRAGESRTLELDKIGESHLKLIHLTGTEPVELTNAQIQAIDQYVKRGGTILIETVGGGGHFSQGIIRQLNELFTLPAVPLIDADPVISGQGLTNGFDCRHVLYRRHSVVSLDLEPKPRLAAFLDDQGRPAIIISHDDLSLGMIGSGQWDILGYQPSTTRKLLTNIVLWVQQQSSGGQHSHVTPILDRVQ